MSDTVNIIQQVTEVVTISDPTTEIDVEIVTNEIVENIQVIEQSLPGAPGNDGAVQMFVVGEVPTGVLDGQNATFESEFDFQPESVQVFVNGLAQKKVSDFNTSGNREILLNISPQADESVLVNYLRL